MVGEDEIRMEMHVDVLAVVRRRRRRRRRSGEWVVIVDAVMPFESTVDHTDGTGQRVFRLAQRGTHRGDEKEINQTLLDNQFVEQKNTKGLPSK